MAQPNPVDLSKLNLKFLGWGVDCRKPKKEWMQSLKSYDGIPIRELDRDDKNVNKIECDETFSMEEEVTTNIGGNLDGKIFVPCLNSVFKLGFAAKYESKYSTKFVYEAIGTATLQEDIRKDPGAIKVSRADGEKIYYAKFEEKLCSHILQYAGKKQEELPSQVRGELGVPVRELPGETAIARLQHFTKGKEPHLWQLVADACTSFVEEKKYTHYVYSITLGKNSEKYGQDQDGKVTVRGGAKYYGGDVNAEVEASIIYRNRKTDTQLHVIGEKHPEVIEVKIKPLSDLISKQSHGLKTIMERLLESYTYGETQGKPFGPFKISFYHSKELRRFYWQVTDTHIYVTGDGTVASEFFIKNQGSEKFSIGYKNPDGVQYALSFEDGLQLERAAKKPKISFVLENAHQEAVELPSTPAGWIREGFFIKTTGGVIFQILNRLGIVSETYIAMEKCDTPTRKYKAVSKAKIKGEEDLMLFTMEYQLINIPQLPMAIKASIPHKVGGRFLMAHGPEMATRSGVGGETKEPVMGVDKRITPTSARFNTLLGASNYSFPKTISADDIF